MNSVTDKRALHRDNPSVVVWGELSHGVDRAPYGMRPPTVAGSQERIAHALELIAQRLALLEYHVGELRLEMLEMQMRLPPKPPRPES